MKTRKAIGLAMITACFALCATVWPQNEAIKEVPAPLAVTTSEATVEEFKAEVEIAEAEKAEMPQLELAEQAAPKSKPVPAVPDIQPTPESGAVAEQTTKPLRTQETIEPPSGDMVYVPGFGWIESQGPNHVEYAEDTYENGNKVGIMA